jgi:hypothetical protein
LPSIPQISAPQQPVTYGTGQLSDAERNMTQEQTDKLGVTDKIGLGVDHLGDFLFGPGSVLHNTPVSGLVGFGGDVLRGAADLAVVKPIQAVQWAGQQVPLGWLPGGADETFGQLGDWAKQHDPSLYNQWLQVDAAAKGNWDAGNLHAQFNTEALQYLDDQSKETHLGEDPTLAIGRAGVGSLGDAFGKAVTGWLGLLGSKSQQFLGNIGAFNPETPSASFEQMLAYHKNPGAYVARAKPTDSAEYAFQQMDKGLWTEQQARDYIAQAGGHLSRVEESAMRLDRGGEVSDVEAKAIEAWRSGAWSLDHANTWINTHGQGITRNPVGQIAGSLVTDPLTYATIGAGAIAKAGTVGARLAEAGVDASSTYEKLGMTINSIQKSQLGPAFRLARGMIDPLAVYKPGSVATAVTDLRNGTALEAFQRAYGPQTITDLRALAREAGVTPEIDSAIASYSIDKANEMIAQYAQRNMLEQGLGEELVHSNVDSVIDPMAQNAGKNAVTELTDHMMSVAKNTFTPDEEANLAGRLAATFGKDQTYWEARLPKMSFDLKSALHAITYKRAEVGFEQARATMMRGAYSGDLPLDNMVLMDAGSLDNVTTESVIANIRDALKNDAMPQRIATATAEWNALARKYPTMANIGYATGGKEQLEALVKELEKQLQSGGIMRRVTEDELSDPVMRPISQFLDRNTAPSANATALAAKGRALLDQIDAQPSSPIPWLKSGTPEYDRVVDGAYDSVKTGPWGGMTFDAHTGDPVGAEAMYHGTSARNEASIAKSGINRGDWINDAKSKLIPSTGGPKLLYRTKVEHLVGGTEKAPGWRAGGRVAADKLEVSRDGGSTWETVTGGPRVVQGPFTGSVGRQTDMPIADIADKAKFTQTFDRFVAENKAQLEKAGHQIGIFRNEDTGLIELDVVYSVPDAESARAIQMVSPQAQTGGWYNHADGPEGAGIYPPSASELGSQPLWRVGFRPDEEVAWGLKRDASTGKYVVDRAPTISHVVDAVPGRQPFSDTTRNALGQIIGKSRAERLNGPIDSIEAMTNTMRDVVTGRRLVMNIEKRFERSTFDAGIPKPIARDIMAKAKEVAGLDYSTVRGIKPDNLWNAIHDIVPRDLVLKDGTHLNVHIVMDHLLQAAEGDLRIMGLTSVFSQRMRNRLRLLGDGGNWGGQVTVGLYNKLRYAFNPTFVIQRITDAPYYSILYGVTPVGRGALTGAKAELEKITENLGRTGLARDFSMDMPEYATRANFTAGIKSAMQEAGLKDNRLQRILEAPDTIIANNMTNMLYARLGSLVRGSLDNLAAAAEADPSLKAELLAQGEVLQRSFGDWRRVYSEGAGRVLDDNEVGLKYIQDQLNAWRRVVVHENGTLDFSRLVADGERAMPSEIADIGPIRPDILAQELGYADGAALRRDVIGHVEKINGAFTLVKGEHDLPWLEEQLRETLGAHPDYVRRASAYFGETWDDFWTRLSRGVDQGGLDISPHYAKEAQDLIAMTARERGMDPWEYLSGVMASNIGAQDLETHMGQLVGFLKAGKTKAPLEEWTKMFRATLDPSAQRKLLQEFEQAVNVEDVMHVPTPGKFGVDAKGNSVMPAGYKAEPGYVYRIDVLDKMRGGWRKGEGVSIDANPMYNDGRPGLGVFRSKVDPADLKAGRNAVAQPGGKDRLTAKAIAPENIEMLGPDGAWHSLGEDPMTKVMAKDFPEAVRQRVLSGVPHPDPEIEGYMQALSKWVQEAIGPELGERTRADLRRLVEAVPTTHATSFNRSQALVVSLLKQKINEAQSDIFRLAEMQTQRSVLERSLNHPLFGLYPSSYMWGKVLPETLKFLARNPYAATYAIADVQRAIAIQRAYDPDMEHRMNAIDRSSAAFLLDYLTPSLPWSDHSARMSPMVRDLFKGQPENIWTDELGTISPERWVNQFARTTKEGLDLLKSQMQSNGPEQNPLPSLQSLAGGGAPEPATPSGPTPITGPIKGSGLGPILADDLTRLQSILLNGQSPAQ